MSGSKERRQLEKKLRTSGYTTRVTSRGHLMVYLGSEVVTCFGGTPSDHRSWNNSLAPLRRLGFSL